MPLAVVLWCGLSPAETRSFTIRSADAPPVEIRYFLRGAFGGFGGFVREADEGGVYQIPLFVDSQTERAGDTGTPAESLKAILYAPGCQFNLLSVDLKATMIRTATFACTPLTRTTLNGRISSLVSDSARLDVGIYYMASWGHSFFGFLDGPVEQFSIGNPRLAADGRFQVEIPDFSKDSVTTQMQPKAYLKVVVIEHSGGDRVQMAVPPANLLHNSIGLKILSHYDSQIPFSFRPSN